jgi:TRAP-type C4-dicarboxylate transport system permease small subunit
MTEPKHHAWPLRGLTIVGGGALLVAMACDALGVIGRQTGHPFIGAIELVQAAILVAGSAGLLIASLTRVHATVHLLVERLPEGIRDAAERITRAISSLFFIAAFAGSVWLAVEAWPGHEASEVLGIPYPPLRVISCAAVAAVAVVFLWQSITRRRS